MATVYDVAVNIVRRYMSTSKPDVLMYLMYLLDHNVMVETQFRRARIVIFLMTSADEWNTYGQRNVPNSA